MTSGAADKNAAPVEELRRQLAALKAEVTNQQWLLDALESQSAQYRALFDLMPGSVVLLDAKGFIRDANPYFCRAMGYTREELVGKHVTQISQQPTEVIERNIRRMISGEILQHEVTNVQKDGSLRFYELREAAVTLPDGSMNILAVSNDITDRRRAEQARLEMERELFHAQKLDSLGVLAGGIAHDFNNLLTVILSNIELAISDVPATSSAQNVLTSALLAGKRAAELTHLMLAYSGRGRFATAELDLSKIVRDLTDLLRVSISKSARLEMVLGSDLPLIQADATQLQQVLMNLVTNSSEAIGDQPGTITVRTCRRECDAAYLSGSRTAIKPKPGDYAVLEIKDTGSGMDEVICGKLFDPFFTTKFVGRGLGMSAVLGIAQGHQGAIMVSSEPGKGTVVSVLFPAAPATARTAKERDERPPGDKSAPSPISGTVLIADNDAEVRAVTELLLERMGLSVLSADNGKSAVKLFRKHAGDIKFVLIDLSMSKLDGAKTLAEIRRVRPDAKVVLTSGYEGSELMQRHQAENIDAFIQKPFDFEDFKKIVQQVCR